MGHRNIMFAISGVLLAVSIAALLIRGLSFGIEFQGGTVVNATNVGAVTIEQMRTAVEAQKIPEAEIQTAEGGSFIIRTNISNPAEANAAFGKVADELNLPAQSLQVTTIGPGWGRNVTNAALLALTLSIGAILLYTAIRFEYKMAVMAVVALVHDIIITLGIYALLGAEVTPNTIAALLTIMGFSLYDTIVVFHRIKENAQHLVKQTFMQMANDSINQVLVRSINTTLTSLIPVVSLLLFGGATLKDFALALTVGLLVGAYSSIGVAAPIFAIWKEREPKYKALAKKYQANAAS
ncbi:MAG: protein translocase subunit SecF [Coriobacteriales bacterium]|nr:protein translocase subunit SecF [Coriobacteriales bacterium]